MRTVKNITVAVDPELYRQTRRLAIEYNTSVTDMVRFLLLALPDALKAARYPGGRPQFGIPAARAAAATPAAAKPEAIQSAGVTSALMPDTSIPRASAHLDSTHNSFPPMQIAHFTHPPPPQKRQIVL
jgi:hypothetical protein